MRLCARALFQKGTETHITPALNCLGACLSSGQARPDQVVMPENFLTTPWKRPFFY